MGRQLALTLKTRPRPEPSGESPDDAEGDRDEEVEGYRLGAHVAEGLQQIGQHDAQRGEQCDRFIERLRSASSYGHITAPLELRIEIGGDPLRTRSRVPPTVDDAQ